MRANINVEQIKNFKNDLLTMDVNRYMEFVTPLTKFEWKVLSDFMFDDFIYYFKTFEKIYNKFYKFIGNEVTENEIK